MNLQTSELEKSRNLLVELGLDHASEMLLELVERAVREKLTLVKFLELVAGKELEFRDERRVKTLLSSSGLPIGKTLNDFDFHFQSSVEKGKVELLATCEFVKRKENILLLGPPGVGKSHLAAGLGVKAAENGFAVVFMNADDLIEILRKNEDLDNRKIRRRRYMNASLLIIDELGFQSLDRHDSHLLFKVISQRYERASVVITSNKGIRDWPDMLAGDEMLATAILDRLLHHCHVIQIDGRSYRLKHIELGLNEGGKKAESST